MPCVRAQIAVVIAGVAIIVAGCGGNSGSERAAIEAALTRSPLSYFHYQAPVWTGHRLTPTLGVVKSSGNLAVALVSIPVGPRYSRVQWALLTRGTGAWRAVASVTGRARYLPCQAQRTVMKKLAGGCETLPTNEGGFLQGPRETRRPTAAERLGIIAAAKRRIGLYGHDSCITYDAAVSTVDQRYARIGFTFHKPYGNCHLFNGIDLVQRTPSGWKVVGEGSVAFPCGYAPPGVVRSLYGICATLKG